MMSDDLADSSSTAAAADDDDDDADEAADDAEMMDTSSAVSKSLIREMDLESSEPTHENDNAGAADSFIDNVDSDLDDNNEGIMMASTPASTVLEWLRTIVSPHAVSVCFSYHHDSLVFALRFSVATTAASLFLFAFPPEDPWPQPAWIYVTCCIISWQPQIDTASIIQKTVQRTLGTLLGAILGMAFGFLSLVFPTLRGQAIFMGCIVAIQGFLYPYICDQFGYRASYVAVISCVTFSIVFFSFFNTDPSDHPWTLGIYRMVNILIGCGIAALCGLIIWPVSTKDALVRAIHNHMKLTGQSSEMILDKAVAIFAGEIKPKSIVEVIIRRDDDDDVHRTYVKNIDGWKKCRDMFPMLQYDPFFRSLRKEDQYQFTKVMALRLARSFRIEMNLVLLDAMVRLGFSFEAPHESFKVIKDAGRKVKLILDLTVDQTDRDEMTMQLLETDLINIRSYLAQMTDSVPHFFPKVDIKALEQLITNFAPVSPLSEVDMKGEQTILFLMLVEHLILRVARLHHYCMEYSVPLNGGCCSKGKQNQVST